MSNIMFIEYISNHHQHRDNNILKVLIFILSLFPSIIVTVYVRVCKRFVQMVLRKKQGALKHLIFLKVTCYVVNIKSTFIVIRRKKSHM